MPGFRSAVTLVALIAFAACAHQPPRPAYDRAVGLESFDAAWRIVHETHFDTTFNGVDWVALGDSLRPRARDARTITALRNAIDALLDRLGQSHFALIPRELADTLDPAQGEAVRGSTGLDVRLIDGRLVVTAVDSGGAAHDAGVRAGWVLEVAGTDTASAWLARLRGRAGRYRTETAAWREARRQLAPPPDGALEVVLLDGGDRPRRLRLVSRAEDSEPVRLGDLPTFFARFEHRRAATPAGACVGVIRFNGWLAPLMRRLDAAVDADRGCAGMVIDLRGNTGGMAAMIAGVSGHFLDRRDTLGLLRTRQSTLAIVANPRRVSADARPVRPFAGPLAILVDEGSASASEVFAGGMQALGRARVFGTTTMGAVLGAAFDRLPDGDVLYHAFGDFLLPRGGGLEGRGVVPDVAAPPTRAALLAGPDPALDAAVDWIAAAAAGASR